MSSKHIMIREFIYPPTYSENNIQTVFFSPYLFFPRLVLHYLFAKSLSGPASSRCHYECLLIYGTTIQCKYCHEHYTYTYLLYTRTLILNTYVIWYTLHLHDTYQHTYIYLHCTNMIYTCMHTCKSVGGWTLKYYNLE